jgi:hypothetical protein
MPFAITSANLKETMKEPGCPICSLERKASRKLIDVFLHENLMDYSLRDQALAAYGYCPAHTRLLAAMELSSSGTPIGVNILYEVLNQRTSRELADLAGQQSASSFAQRLLNRLGIQWKPPAGSILNPAVPCPACEAARQAALNNLSALFEEIERGTADIIERYEASDGLCLAHLRLGLLHAAQHSPGAARYLAKRASAQLEEQAGYMKEFIRKNNWEYRSESLTPEEARAWQHSLTFYTGYPAETFTFNNQEPER